MLVPTTWQDDVEEWASVPGPDAFPPFMTRSKGSGSSCADAQVSMMPQNYVKLEGQAADR